MKGYIVKDPLRPARPEAKAKNMTFPPLVYMSGAQVPGVRYNIEFGWVWGLPGPEPDAAGQASARDEVILNIGGDCRDPEDLGADIEFLVGGQTLRTGTTGALFVPRGSRTGRRPTAISAIPMSASRSCSARENAGKPHRHQKPCRKLAPTTRGTWSGNPPMK